MSPIFRAFTIHVCLIIFFINPQKIIAEDDKELWNSIGIKTKLPNSLELELEQSLRFRDQMSSFKQTFTELSVSYEIIDDLKLFIPIRYALFRDKEKKRLSIGGSYKYDYKLTNIRYRIKLQRTHEDNESPADLFRQKISLEYKMNKKLRPFISGEVSYNYEMKKYQYDENRLSFGVGLNLSKSRKIKIFYIRKLEKITKSNPDLINVFGVGYNFVW